MEPRFYYGKISPNDFAKALLAHFNRGNLVAQKIGEGDRIVVQISTRRQPTSGGQTGLKVLLNVVEDGVAVQLGKHNVLGVAASLGVTAMTAWRNPLSLIGRLDDLAQDLENLQLSDQVWRVIENVARFHNASFELSDRLKRLSCDYCRTANPVGTPHCIACGAPMGDIQPSSCPNCGFIIQAGESTCSNCGRSVRGRANSPGHS
ncbi:MAG: zinc ribbon domain-containing protein [Anaerolineales bacterium]|nr:zinc ribbon domain-containing protein [Anaerolineales bacterium]